VKLGVIRRKQKMTKEIETVILYRPTGPNELKLVEDSGFKRWPPRLPEQPIFYPVTNEEYAREIATKWNIKDSVFGFVTRFQVKKTFMDRYSIEQLALHIIQSGGCQQKN